MLRIKLTAEGGETGFRAQLEGADGFTSALSRPVLGLTPTEIGEGVLCGGDERHRWETAFYGEAGGCWVETELEVMRPVEFDPSMLLWLGALDHMNDRQAHTWRQTVLRAPTANQQGLGGNDLPACYLYDHEKRIETICYFPPDGFGWAPNRFYDFSAREVMQYRPAPRYGVGLLANAPQTPLAFAPGTYRLRWWFTQVKRQQVPSAWEAQKALIDALAPLLDPEPALSTHPADWGKVAHKTLEDLHDDACWTTADEQTGLRAYVLGSSAVKRDEQRGFELMTQLDVLWPLLLWSEATGSPRADAIAERLLATLPLFGRPEHHFVANGYPRRGGDTFMDTWYFLENACIKLGWVAHLTGDAALREMFRSAMDGARTLYDNTGGVFPLFADAADWMPRHSLPNASVGGLYAAGCVIAAQLFDDRTYLDRAAAALTVLHQLPPHLLTHEPQQLSFSAAAARYLAVEGYGDAWRQTAADFVRLSLRMGYWGADPAVPYYDPRGMFQACASLSYPAYKENVETLLAWPELLRDDTGALPAETMAAFANLQRVHNAAFFDPWLPPGLRRGPCPHIPYEDLATAEFPHTAKLGKELYGAGEVFWSALMFGMAAQADVPDVLVLALDVPCLELRPIPTRDRRLLLYNPKALRSTVRLTSSDADITVELMPRSVKIIEDV